MLFLSEERVRHLLRPEELVPALERALVDYSRGQITQPLRMIVPVTEHAGWFALMPAVYGEVMGAKLVTVFPANANRGLHTHLATILLFRAGTGEPIAVMDGRWITAWRTAAVSALATRELAKRDARVLAILGSGIQARTHFEALKWVRQFDEIRVWSRTPEHAARFAADIGARAMEAERAVRGADVIVTATNASEPVLYGGWLKDGAHVNGIGAIGPRAREIDDEAMKDAAIVVECRHAASQESGDIIQSGARVYAELGELLAGDKTKPSSRITIYKSLGIAVEDIAAARLVYEKAAREQMPPDCDMFLGA